MLVLPAFAFANEIIPVFSRKAIFGYPAMVAASVGIGFISLGVWAHHMFTIGMTSFGNAFFTLSTMLVSIPTGIKIFNWLATMWGGKIRFETPMLFSMAFLFQCVIAGLTGIMLSISAWNWQLHNSYFVVAHFHYVLVGAIVFMIFAALYYWYPKMTGRMLDERLGKWHFWLMVIGFHVTFDTMHFPGLLGMPRQIYTYEPDRGWTLLNQIVSRRRVHPGALQFSSLSTTWCTRTSAAKRPAPTRGMRGRWSGPLPRRRRCTTSQSIRRLPAAVRCGT